MNRPMLLITLLLLSPSVALAAEPYEAVWDFKAQIEGSTVRLSLTTRYVACGMGATVVRIGPDGKETTVWQAEEEGLGLDTVDMYLDCACEPVGSSHGTGLKSCPESQCTKDEQCACSKLCQDVEDACPPAGTNVYRIIDLNGAEAATLELQVPADLPGCPASPEEPAKEETVEENSGGGCAAGPAPGTTGALLFIVLLLVLSAAGSHRTPRRFLFPLAAMVALSTGCAGDPVEEAKKNAKDKTVDDRVLQPVEGSIEGTPWEKVVGVQTELLDFFETGSDADSILKKIKRWKRNRLPEFGDQCKAALAYYAKDPDLRMSQFARAGQAWSVVKNRIGTMSREWGPAEKHDVGILLNEFSCR